MIKIQFTFSGTIAKPQDIVTLAETIKANVADLVIDIRATEETNKS